MDKQPTVLDKVTWPVHTERLTIRRPRMDDADALFAIRRREEVSRWLTRWVTEREAWDEVFADYGWHSRCLVVEHEGRVIGDLMARMEDPYAQAEVAEQAKGTQAELGWVIDPTYAGRGLATEAVRELIRICFEEIGTRRVLAYCFADNEPSWRLMERVGMRRETHTVRDSLHRERGWLDGYGYALLAEEWRAGHGDR